ncbi:fused MFS/spermidine synthase [Candidatus Gottesmanbacteria bacterium]|nr:fused MFS/spermidine synthase [Candidatus Gottesmanbacteria bacterium]
MQTSSVYNPDIRVVEEREGPKLLVNGSRQSGPYIRELWGRAFRAFSLPKDEERPTFLLVLGVGGGTVIELLAKRFPNTHITAVDIDPMMVTIAKQYFQIDKIANVRLVRADAKIYVDHCRKKGTLFDIVVVDLFIGRKVPDIVSSRAFLSGLHAIVRPRGYLLINYLRELEYQTKSDELCERLKALWRHVEDMSLYNNRFFFAHT